MTEEVPEGEATGTVLVVPLTVTPLAWLLEELDRVTTEARLVWVADLLLWSTLLTIPLEALCVPEEEKAEVEAPETLDEEPDGVSLGATLLKALATLE